MKSIDFNYLGLPKEHPIEALLSDYGGQIYTNTLGYISPVYASGLDISGTDLQSVSLYLVAHHIDKSHKLIFIERYSVEQLSIFLWPIDSLQPVRYDATISDDNLSDLDDKLFDLFKHEETQKVIKLLVKETQSKLSSELKTIFNAQNM